MMNARLFDCRLLFFLSALHSVRGSSPWEIDAYKLGEFSIKPLKKHSPSPVMSTGEF